MRFAWLVALAGCGRLGFDAIGTPAPTGAMIRVVVNNLTDTRIEDEPFSGAIVLVDRGTGDYDRLITDEAGSALFPAEGVVAYHVMARDAASGAWGIYTIAAPRAGTLELGGGIGFDAINKMTLTLPADGVSTSYWVSNAGHCIQFVDSTTHTLALNYQPKCEGRTVHVFGYSQPGASIDYLDAGTVTFANGSSQSLGGTYAPATVQTLQIDHLPAAATSASAQIFGRSGGDLLALSEPAGGTVSPAGSATFALTAAPGGSAVHVSVNGIDTSSPSSQLAVTELLAPAMVQATTAIDASTMLPLFDSLTLGANSSFAWTGGGTGGTVISFVFNTLSLSWHAFLEPTATEVTFPTFPADLGVPTPGFVISVLVTKIDVPGAATNDVIRAFDRNQDEELPDVPELAPATGSAISRIEYSIF